MRIKALLLDMDNTLLDIDFDGFMEEYYKRLIALFAQWAPEERVRHQLFQSIELMAKSRRRDRTILETFTGDFFPAMGFGPEAFDALMQFYVTEYPELRRWAKPMPYARELIEAAFEKGLTVVIATGPLFPEVALRERLRWAEVADYPYRLVTSAEIMHSAKPFPEYYEEISEQIEIAPHECLMVGDETVMDGTAALAGMHVALVGPDRPAAIIRRFSALAGDLDVGELKRYPTLRQLGEVLAAQGVLQLRA